jgi:hypothetical protein
MSILSKETQMTSVVELWKESGMSKKGFALKHGISYDSIKYWIRKFYPEEPTRRSSSNNNQDFSFIELNQEEFKAESSRAPQIELILPNGIQLKIY